MITSLAQCIAGFLLRNKTIDGKKLDIYIYGFEIMISSVISILSRNTIVGMLLIKTYQFL